MFQDRFLINFVLFLFGVAAAFWWLRTGMVRRGVIVLAVLTTAADIALVARFVNNDLGAAFAVSLSVMQATAVCAVLYLLFKLARRRWAADSRRRRELTAAAFRHYLRDEMRSAGALFQRIRRVDPWDVPATIGLANVRWRQGEVRRARALYRRAERLDRRHGHTDFVEAQLRRTAPAAGRPAR